MVGSSPTPAIFIDGHPVRLKEGCPVFSGKMRWQDPHGVIYRARDEMEDIRGREPRARDARGGSIPSGPTRFDGSGARADGLARSASIVKTTGFDSPARKSANGSVRPRKAPPKLRRLADPAAHRSGKRTLPHGGQSRRAPSESRGSSKRRSRFQGLTGAARRPMAERVPR